MSFSTLDGVLGSRSDDVDCDVNIGGTGLAVIWTMVTIASIIVTARIYTQIRITRQFGLSDYLMICSIVVLTGFASLISVQYHFGWGRHQSCITDLTEIETQIKFNIAGQSFGIMGSTFARTSFIVFMITLFGSKSWVWWTLWSLFVAQFITNVGTVVTIYAQCKDVRALYIFTLPEDLCWPSYVQTYLGWAHTSFNGVCDVFLSVLPTVMVWNLHMALRLKIGLAILLSMSALCLVGLVMKCVYLDALSNQGDYSYNTVPMFTWITVEGTLVAIAASVPLLRPLLKHGGKRIQNTYELPRYASRSGHTDSSGFSKIGKVRTSVKGAMSPRTGDFDNDSEEGILVMQGSEITNQKTILVKQEYTVTREPRSKDGMGGGWDAGEGEKDMGLGGGGVGRESSVETERVRKEPQQPASVWTRR